MSQMSLYDHADSNLDTGSLGGDKVYGFSLNVIKKNNSVPTSAEIQH